MYETSATTLEEFILFHHASTDPEIVEKYEQYRHDIEYWLKDFDEELQWWPTHNPFAPHEYPSRHMPIECAGLYRPKSKEQAAFIELFHKSRRDLMFLPMFSSDYSCPSVSQQKRAEELVMSQL